jgi:hypothetical protein
VNSGNLDDVLKELITLCGELAQGEYGNVDSLFHLTKEGSRHDLIRELAESFGMMVVKVEAREFRLEGMIRDLEKAKAQLEIARQKLAEENIQLKSEVRKLKIEIDLTEKDREVAKITETDYFRNLRKRAREIKGSRKP